MKSKLMLTLFTVLLFLTFGYEAHAENLHDSYEDISESNLKNSIILSAESPIAFIDGQTVSGVQPIIRNGRMLVPLRFISEGFGAKVDYNDKNKSIEINLNGNNISLKLETNNISINGQSKAIDVAPSIYNNLTYIPLRDIGEALNKKVVYLKNTEIQSHSLIILRDTTATAIENLNLVHVLDLLYKGKTIVYSDRFMVVIKENGHLLFSNNFYDFNPFEYKEFSYDENNIKLGDIWFKTDMGNIYLNYGYNTTREFSLYRVEGENIQRLAVEKAPIKEVKTYHNDVYYLTRYERGVLDGNETSNLKSAKLTNGQWLTDYLGKPGFYYGFDTLGNSYDWTIDDNGISIFGYQRFGDLSSDERKQTFGNYRIKLSGHQHELIRQF